MLTFSTEFNWEFFSALIGFALKIEIGCQSAIEITYFKLTQTIYEYNKQIAAVNDFYSVLYHFILVNGFFCLFLKEKFKYVPVGLSFMVSNMKYAEIY